MTDFRADVKKAVEFGIARFAPIWQLDWNNIMAESRGMTDRELMQQALDAMLNFPNDISDEMFESIKALRARLAQPEQEWQGLTDEEYTTIMQQADHDAAKTGSVFQNLRYAIEAKLKEKNT